MKSRITSFLSWYWSLAVGILRCQPQVRQVMITLPRYILTRPVTPGTRYALHLLQYLLLSHGGILTRSFMAIRRADLTQW